MLNLERLKSSITESGVSQAYICRELGKHRHFLNDLWMGKTSLSDKQIETIAKILHVSVDYLVSQSDEKEIKKETAVADDLDREILELFSSLSAEQKIRFLDLLRSLKPPTA